MTETLNSILFSSFRMILAMKYENNIVNDKCILMSIYTEHYSSFLRILLLFRSSAFNTLLNFRVSLYYFIIVIQLCNMYVLPIFPTFRLGCTGRGHGMIDGKKYLLHYCIVYLLKFYFTLTHR